MEASKTGLKKRVLPFWMTAQESPPLVKTPKKRRTVVPASVASRPAVRTVYCMSEAELVDVALGILLEGRQQTVSVEVVDKPELTPICSASPESRSEDEEDTRKDSLYPGSELPSGAPGDSESTCDGSAEADDDALKYVREIFFS